MEIKDFIDTLNFDEYDYFYHETSKNNGKKICEEGLLVDGTNILNTNNILFTTASPLTKDFVEDPNNFIKFLEQEKTHSTIRDVSEMVIICAPKEYEKQIINEYQDYDENGNYYKGIIENNFIAGFIDLNNLEFHENPDFEFSDDYGFKL